MHNYPSISCGASSVPWFRKLLDQLTMVQLSENDHKDGVIDKVDISHDEDAFVQADREMTAWQCICANPKVALWTLYANSKSIRPWSFRSDECSTI